MATLTYSEGCCSLFRILCSIICPHKLLFNLWLSLAPKRLLFVSYKSQKRAAKYSLLHCQKEAIRELQPLAQYCAHAHSVPRVQFLLLWGSTSLVPRPYFSCCCHCSSICNRGQNEAAKKEMGVQLRKSKAWFGKSRDPQGFLRTWAICSPQSWRKVFSHAFRVVVRLARPRGGTTSACHPHTHSTLDWTLTPKECACKTFPLTRGCLTSSELDHVPSQSTKLLHRERSNSVASSGDSSYLLE